ncbi:MAG: YggS family pyridoxal phosphate-dependent enzyme [Gammaproteobacteria bacterium]|nr:YggS family pyridoxal phosphate-dependent enzyme [Gammaproteobacteria bacterium]
MTIARHLTVVKQRIDISAAQAGRNPGEVKLIAVSKTKSVDVMLDAWRAGQFHFAESYVQEALVKQKALSHVPLCWHFVGPVQSNKTAAIANHFSWVHSVDRLKIARRLSEQRRPQLAPLNICLQVNISHETSKHGVIPDHIPALIEQVGQLSGVVLRGLMFIPKRTESHSEQRYIFKQANSLFNQYRSASMDTLSMGMSSDLEAAIVEGATMVRIGTALFGPRE